MAAIKIGEAATAGLGLIARRPFSVLIWGLLTGVYVAGVLALFGAGILASVAGLLRVQGTTPTPGQILGVIGSVFGAALLLIIGLIVIGAMIQGAAFRAELEPNNRGFAYLRLGGGEMWLIAVNFVLAIVVGFAETLLMIPVMVTSVALGATGAGLAASGHGSATFGPALAASFVIPVIGMLIVLLLTLWIWLRLCLGPVMSFRDRQFRLFESWSLTKGHAWGIFAVVLLVGLMLVGLEIIFSIIASAGFGATVLANGALRDPKALAAMPPSAWIAGLMPLLILFGVLLVVRVSVSNALIWGAVARIYRQLHPDADVSTTFA